MSIRSALRGPDHATQQPPPRRRQARQPTARHDDAGRLRLRPPTLDLGEQIHAHHQLGFAGAGGNIVFLRPPASARLICRSRSSSLPPTAAAGYYGTLAALIGSLEGPRITGTFNRHFRILSSPALLIVYEIANLSFTPPGATVFFQLVNRRYEHVATFLLSNTRLEEWAESSEIWSWPPRCSTDSRTAATSSTSKAAPTVGAAAPTSPGPSIPVMPATSPRSGTPPRHRRITWPRRPARCNILDDR